MGHQLEVSMADESLLLGRRPGANGSGCRQPIGERAAKYTEMAGGKSGLTAQREGAKWSSAVRDNGIGIASDMLPHVFELFVQADHTSTRAQGGLGIGLTLVKNLVEMHNGTVTARSAGLGKGSEFVVRLPLIVQDHQKRTGQDRTEPMEEMQISGRRLLVVDDNKDAAVSLALLLRTQGHDVRVAHNGAVALELITTYRPDTVFLDLGMPGMDGYEVARQVRKIPGLEKTVLAALTGWGQQEDRRRTTEAGFDYHLVKPIDVAEIIKLLA